jgi:hypothetical protein
MTPEEMKTYQREYQNTPQRKAYKKIQTNNYQLKLSVVVNRQNKNGRQISKTTTCF